MVEVFGVVETHSRLGPALCEDFRSQPRVSLTVELPPSNPFITRYLNYLPTYVGCLLSSGKTQ
jgi:hypothetical protein